MIRTSTSADLDTILKIWLESNLQAHSFIPSSYWTSHVEFMRSHACLSLSVYAKNQQAIDFYLREGFEIMEEGLDIENHEKEFRMQWKSEDEICPGLQKRKK